MPLIKLTMRSGRTAGQKRRIMDGVHGALVDALRIPENDRFQFVNEIPEGNWDCPERPDRVLVEIKLFAGRSLEAKRALYAAVTANLEACGVDPLDVFVVLSDEPLENWGIRGGQAACDLDLGFKVDV